MENFYRCLSQQIFSGGEYKIVPLQWSDRYNILEWRNQQIDILRQKNPLSVSDQEAYFENKIKPLFKKDKPGQILWSFLKEDITVGYGGLVHIDWESKNAEISFLNKTERSRDAKLFEEDFSFFLKLVTTAGFKNLNFFKLHTTCYEIPEREVYIRILMEKGFVLEGNLKDHVFIKGTAYNVHIYSIFKKDTGK